MVRVGDAMTTSGAFSSAEAFALCCAAVVTLVICLRAFPIGLKLSVLSYPDECRKLHQGATPQLGGLAILAGLLVWVAVVLLANVAADRHLLFAIGLSAVGVGAVGFADDQTGLTPGARVVMLIAFLAMAFLVDHDFASMRLNWGSFEPTHIPIWAYVPLMALTAGGVVNAVNMADGQDGVAGGMFVTWSGCLMLVTTGTAAAIAGVICVLSLVFLVFNLRGKIFLGDCGSYGITFVLGLLVTLAHARGQLTLETVIVWFFIPVADCLRLLISRPLRGRSPFLADRDHFHHRLEDKMGKQQGLVCYLAAVTISCLVAALEPRFALVCLCVLSAFYFSFARLTDANIPAQAEEISPVKAADNVVSLPTEKLGKPRHKGTA
jgi:UDP-GlcNAc:undecaprenyl-phosphate/decaprenyl-phosphate GlcNAc-1-phosphate transferase